MRKLSFPLAFRHCIIKIVPIRVSVGKISRSSFFHPYTRSLKTIYLLKYKWGKMLEKWGILHVKNSVLNRLKNGSINTIVHFLIEIIRFFRKKMQQKIMEAFL